MPDPVEYTVDDTRTGRAPNDSHDYVTFTKPARVVTICNLESNRMYVIFDPTDKTISPEANVAGSKFIPPKNHRTFQRRGQGPVTMCIAVWDGIDLVNGEYTADTEAQ